MFDRVTQSDNEFFHPGLGLHVTSGLLHADEGRRFTETDETSPV